MPHPSRRRRDTPAPAPSPATKPLSPQKQNAEARARIAKADPAGFLIAVMRGEPIPRRDIDGNVIGFSTEHQSDIPLRAAAAEKLIKRLIPELKSVEMTTPEGGTVFRVVAPFQVPGSARPELLEADITSTALETTIRHLAEED